MRLTTFSDYAIRVLIFLAAKEEENTTIQEIADSYGISKNHLMKVVQELHQKGYVHATRGKKGGLRLKLPPQEINIGTLIRDVEKDLMLVECFSSNNSCVVTPVCGLKPIFAKALDAFFEALDDYTLADVLPGNRKKHLLQILHIE